MPKPCKHQTKPAKAEIGLVIRGVYNEDIVETFVTKYSEAVDETKWHIEWHNGTLKLWFELKDVAINDHMQESLERAGFEVTR